MLIQSLEIKLKLTEGELVILQRDAGKRNAFYHIENVLPTHDNPPAIQVTLIFNTESPSAVTKLNEIMKKCANT